MLSSFMLLPKRKKHTTTKRATKKSTKSAMNSVKNDAVDHMQLAELSIRIVRSQRKSISLHIKPEGIILRAPLYSPALALKAFALSKIDWLRKHHVKIQSQRLIREYIDGETWLLFGQNITLRTATGKTSNTLYNPEMQELTIIIGSRVKHTRTFVKQQMHSWYKEMALDYLETRVPKLANEMQLDYKNINARDYKARWGSCSSTGNLSFNWRIFMAPTTVIDSVIVHELAHIKHFNHSKQFWNLVYSNCPEYKKQHAWLKKHQYQLQA